MRIKFFPLYKQLYFIEIEIFLNRDYFFLRLCLARIKTATDVQK